VIPFAAPLGAVGVEMISPILTESVPDQEEILEV
jgi:hypothetical protein